MGACVTRVVALQHVSFTYRDAAEPALRDVNLAIHRGEFVVVMGASGSGKTTLAKCLNRSIPAFQAGTLEGEIEIAGRLLEKEGVGDLAGVVGLVSQDFEAQLFATNAAEEVAFAMEQMGLAPDIMAGRVAEALRLVGLAGFDNRDPATLSGGEKQRLSIAAVLAVQPQLLVFDEPTTDLDPEGKRQIFEVLAMLRGSGATVVLIEHEIAAARHADRLVLMAEGRIVADDRPCVLLPQVERLERLGVRPADLDRIARACGASVHINSIEQAAELVRSRGTVAPATPSHLRSEPLLEVDGISHVYDNGKRALDGVSLQICSGEFLALIGQNGSGKTTLAKHLNGLLRPATGMVRLRGQDLQGLPLNRVAREVGYVFQDPDHQIFASKVYEEVSFGLRNLSVSEAEIEALVRPVLDEVGLVGLDDADPFLLGKGHRQQLAVASILALRPRVLVLDEPTTGLDYPEQRRIMDLLRRLHGQGMALVVITHSPWVVAEYAQRGVLMRDGRLVFDGPLRDLFAREELLEACHFTLPDITRVGRRCGFTPLTLQELMGGEPAPRENA